LIVFPISTQAAFAALQSQPHDAWMRFLGSSMKDDLRYTPEDCFETFPLPLAFEANPELEQAGQACYEHRAALMIQNQQGLTATYNHFHDPQEVAPGILKLRSLHQAMDEAVLRAYGWDDLTLNYGFYPDFEAAEDEDGEPTKVRLRYRWPNSLREEVLGRLLALNAQRAAEEAEARRQREILDLKPFKTTTKRSRKLKLSMAAEMVTPYLIDPEDV
jgi:hypothetical protein